VQFLHLLLFVAPSFFRIFVANGVFLVLFVANASLSVKFVAKTRKNLQLLQICSKRGQKVEKPEDS
jgi:hypothetical protein